ncbi:hypothetical protein ASC77_22605 [Nocardioides sp. Root1257]|uniref:hypothetical protein n=1 Tax=unclassified Nocardioides TaxID=2615069 RepID=UPI0006FD3BD5|nr:MULTISPECIES: hypothetical protein [unclassified Nocardioides]KQW43081.1 hypothetical protein ASC77_22605 [Nocardioides sp. Root1257]KRC41949.1 hypothetical protein ASE24_22395 [Nocardioides sp. Root224]
MRRVAVVSLLLPLLLAGCGDDKDAYCDAVQDHQKDLSETLGDGSPDALLKALGTFQDLADQAPADITDEWQQVIRSLKSLKQALQDAGVDPATYDRAHPPASLTTDEKKKIDAAAADVGSGATLQALSDLDQQARDVCHTPLTV